MSFMMVEGGTRGGKGVKGELKSERTTSSGTNSDELRMKWGSACEFRFGCWLAFPIGIYSIDMAHFNTHFRGLTVMPTFDDWMVLSRYEMFACHMLPLAGWPNLRGASNSSSPKGEAGSPPQPISKGQS